MIRLRPTLPSLFLVSLLSIAPPAAAEDSSRAVERFLGMADMTFTQRQADELTGWTVTTPDGYEFFLSDLEGGYDLDFPDPTTVTPRSGNWSRAFSPTWIECGTDERQSAAIINAIVSVESIANNLIGSNDRGATARYRFTEPFGAGQLLDPILDILGAVEIFSEVRYRPAGANVHEVTGVLSQPSDFDIHFEMTIGVISEDLIFGDWSGTSDPGALDGCRAQGLVAWQRES